MPQVDFDPLEIQQIIDRAKTMARGTYGNDSAESVYKIFALQERLVMPKLGRMLSVLGAVNRLLTTYRNEGNVPVAEAATVLDRVRQALGVPSYDQDPEPDYLRPQGIEPPDQTRH